jgi:hypothetical protein
MKSKNKNKIKPLDSKFFNDLADKIYNNKTRKFLRLCRGKLTNGPDPEDSDRKMHCGLGELYFAMTGEHTGDLSENAVVKITMDNTTLKIKNNKDKENIRNLIKSIKNINSNVKEMALESIDDTFKYNDDYTDDENKIYELLDRIPSVNDCDDHCNIDDDATYKNRSREVAKLFRDIAKKLAVKSKSRSK